MKRLAFYKATRTEGGMEAAEGWRSDAHPDFGLSGDAKRGWKVTHLPTGYSAGSRLFDTRAEAEAWVVRLTSTPKCKAMWARHHDATFGEGIAFTSEDQELLRLVTAG